MHCHREDVQSFQDFAVSLFASTYYGSWSPFRSTQSTENTGISRLKTGNIWESGRNFDHSASVLRQLNLCIHSKTSNTHAVVRSQCDEICPNSCRVPLLPYSPVMNQTCQADFQGKHFWSQIKQLVWYCACHQWSLLNKLSHHPWII